MYKTAKVLSLFIITFIFITGCKDDPSSPTDPGPYQLERPGSIPVVRFHIDYTNDPTGKFSFEVCWNASPGKNDENFTGYAVITYAADYGDSINPTYAVIDSVLLLGHIYSHTVTTIKPNKRYFSEIYTVSFGNILSVPLKTRVFTSNVLAPPQKVVVKIYFDNGYPEALVSWSPSPQENLKDLIGYEALTYNLKKDGDRYFPGQGGASGKKRSIKVGQLYKGAYYRTYIQSIHADGYPAPEIASCIYGYEILDSGQVDEMSTMADAKNAYGWNKDGAGYQFVLSSAKTDSIDICCIKEGSSYILSSPAAVENAPAGARQTKFLKLEKDLWETVINIPFELTNDKVAISEGDVIILKTQDDYYIKLKIKSIASSGSNSNSAIAFDYRFQTMQGLRAAKR